nr:uncharacterized protein LOC111509994 [Leptinotarsa decemlineata]
MATTENHLGYPSNFFYTNEVIRKISGIWLPGNKHRFILRVLYFLYVSFLYGTGLALFICEFLIFHETVKGISKFVSHIGMLFTHVVGILKMSILIFGRKKIQRIMNVLQDENYFYPPLGDSQPGSWVVKEKLMSSGFSILVFVLYTFVGVSAHISSIITINKEVKGDTFIGTNKTCYDYMPYYLHIPFSTETKSKCGVAFAFMDVGLGVFAWVIASMWGKYSSDRARERGRNREEKTAERARKRENSEGGRQVPTSIPA